MNDGYSKLIGILKDEMKPALGVTEVGAIALASSKAYGLIGGALRRVHLTENGGMFKNAHSCFIPGTGKLGNSMAALLGAIAGDSSLGLEALRDVGEEQVRAAEELERNGAVTVTALDGEPQLYIRVEVETDRGTAAAEIRGRHTDIVRLERNGEVLLDLPAGAEDGGADIGEFGLRELYGFCANVPAEDIAFVGELVDVNRALSDAGQAGAGLRVGGALDAFTEKGVVGDDTVYYAQRLTCGALDARLAGLPLPAMSIAGSGSHGALCSLPVSAFAERLASGREAELRAVALSALVTLYIKRFSGRLSSLCGCVIAGATGAGCGIAMLLGGGEAEIEAVVDNMAANLTGMVCDGGSIGCSLKASTGVFAAALSAFLAVNGTSIPRRFGIVGSTAEETVRNIGRISYDGMSNVDRTIIDIMQGAAN